VKKSRLDTPLGSPGFDLPPHALLKNRTGKGYNVPEEKTLRAENRIDMAEEKKQHGKVP